MKKEIHEDVSAMANSAGGVLIYGIREYDDKDCRHLPERFDPVDQTVFTREWLEQVISGIQQRIQGLVITPASAGQNANDAVFVVEVPASSIAHQAGDYRYYRRYNFESVPMNDYEVRDVMNRSTHALIDLEFRLELERLKLDQTKIEAVGVPGASETAPCEMPSARATPHWDGEKLPRGGGRRKSRSATTDSPWKMAFPFAAAPNLLHDRRSAYAPLASGCAGTSPYVEQSGSTTVLYYAKTLFPQLPYRQNGRYTFGSTLTAQRSLPKNSTIAPMRQASGCGAHAIRSIFLVAFPNHSTIAGDALSIRSELPPDLYVY